MTTPREVVTIREQAKNFRDWYAELIAQIPGTVKCRTSLSFTIFSLLSKENNVHVRSFLDLFFESWPLDFNVATFFDGTQETVYKAHLVASDWRRDCSNGQSRMIKSWPQQRSISEVWDIENAMLSEELEKERVALRLRMGRIRKAYSHLGAIEKLVPEQISLMRPRLLLQARTELDAALKLIKRKAGCTIFDADLEAFQKKIIAFIDQPGVEIKFTWL